MQRSRKVLFLTLIICLLFVPNVLAQQTKTDSLLTVIKTAQEDSNKVNTLNLLAKEILSTTGDYVKAAEYCQQAIDLAQRINYKKGNAQALNLLGTTFLYQGDFPNALSNYEASLALYNEIGDRKGKARMYSNIGLVYMYQGDYPNSLKSTK